MPNVDPPGHLSKPESWCPDLYSLGRDRKKMFGVLTSPEKDLKERASPDNGLPRSPTGGLSCLHNQSFLTALPSSIFNHGLLIKSSDYLIVSLSCNVGVESSLKEIRIIFRQKI